MSRNLQTFSRIPTFKRESERPGLLRQLCTSAIVGSKCGVRVIPLVDGVAVAHADGMRGV
jgi:hypothetical protein